MAEELVSERERVLLWRQPGPSLASPQPQGQWRAGAGGPLRLLPLAAGTEGAGAELVSVGSAPARCMERCLGLFLEPRASPSVLQGGPGSAGRPAGPPTPAPCWWHPGPPIPSVRTGVRIGSMASPFPTSHLRYGALLYRGDLPTQSKGQGGARVGGQELGWAGGCPSNLRDRKWP